MRRWLIILVCVALPLQAWAMAPWPPGPCSMVEMVVAQAAQEVADGKTPLTVAPDCCLDLALCLQPGQTCQTGFSAGAPLVGLPPGPAGRVDTSAGLPPAVNSAPTRATTDPDRPWRPPAQS